MSSPAGFSPGVYGKIPHLGDFVSRRLPSGFIVRWDEWLQPSLACSREALGRDWLTLYLSAPLWRFVLQAGALVGDAVAGVLMPSVDAVNRHFPLTVAAGVGSAPGPCALAVEADAWFVAAEDLALSCLDAEANLPTLERALDTLPSLPTSGCGGPRPEALLPPAGDAGFSVRLSAEPPGGLVSAYASVLDAVADRVYSPCSLWWTTGSDGVEPKLMIFSGMPPARAFTSFLTDSSPRASRPVENTRIAT